VGSRRVGIIERAGVWTIGRCRAAVASMRLVGSDLSVVAGMADVLGKLADPIASAAAAHPISRGGALEINP
jgi:hypothetical protein